MPTATMTADAIDLELALWAEKARTAELCGSKIGQEIARRRLDWLLDRRLELPQQRQCD